MAWNATLTGLHTAEDELSIARAIKDLADKIGCGASFWSPNTPIDLDNLPPEPEAPTAKAKTKK